MKLFITVIALLTITLLNGCAAVRMMGKIASATGDIMVKSADTEEAKKTKLKSEQATNDSSGGGDDKKETQNIVTIKKDLTTVKVRPEPSTKKSAITTLTGGDKVDKIGEKGSWLKVRFNVEGNQGEGWIKKDLVDINHATSAEKSSNVIPTGNTGETTDTGSTGEITDIGSGQFDILASGGFSGNRAETYAKWDRTAKKACNSGKYKIIKRDWQSAEYPGLLGGIIECDTQKLSK
jgi:hypothetical protein